jgi:hypothetical protein
VLGLGLVAAGRQRLERAPAEQAHPVLRVAHLAPGDGLERALREPVRDPTLKRHLPEVAEAVADHELRAARRLEEGGDRRRGMLPVRVDDEDCIVRRADAVDAGVHRRALAALRGDAHELDPVVLAERVECPRDVLA